MAACIEKFSLQLFHYTFNMFVIFACINVPTQLMERLPCAVWLLHRCFDCRGQVDNLDNLVGSLRWKRLWINRRSFKVSCNLTRGQCTDAAIFEPVNRHLITADFKHVPWTPSAEPVRKHWLASRERLGACCY